MSDQNPAQAEATRQVAEQLFTVWEAKRAREAKENRRWFSSNIGGWLTAAAVVIGAIVAGDNTYGLANDANARSIKNEKDIAEMRVENSGRLASIESKIDIMLKERGR